jgi:cutinase
VETRSGLPACEFAAAVELELETSSPNGGEIRTHLINQALAQCPSTKLVLSGYSQGGQVVHNSAAALPASTMAKVSSVVIFGDPDSTQLVQGVSPSRTLIICHSGDDICQNGIIIPVEHLTYSQDAGTAANFVVGTLG